MVYRGIYPCLRNFPITARNSVAPFTFPPNLQYTQTKDHNRERERKSERKKREKRVNREREIPWPPSHSSQIFNTQRAKIIIEREKEKKKKKKGKGGSIERDKFLTIPKIPDKSSNYKESKENNRDKR